MIPRLALLAVTALALAACKPAPPPKAAFLSVEHSQFVLTTADGKRLTSKDLIGSTFDMVVGPGQTAQVRIDKVEPSKEQAGVLLHTFSVIDPRTGTAKSLCQPDGYGRQAGFPVRGTFKADGTYIPAEGKDAKDWLLTCTSGSQAKCVLWGYDPDGKTPDGRSLAPWYQACQNVVRANYDGKGEAHTKNGTEIDVWDDIGIQVPAAPKGFVFEAGWAPKGALCVAHTRWPDLLTLAALHKASPQLAGECTPETAKAKGALIYTRVKPR